LIYRPLAKAGSGVGAHLDSNICIAGIYFTCLAAVDQSGDGEAYLSPFPLVAETSDINTWIVVSIVLPE
jgi:delta 1-pyrroline-5-carboxylate dehydrogenase